MSILSALHKVNQAVPVQSQLPDLGYDYLKGKTPTPPPAPPNQNDALNAAQQQSDLMRQRRGLLSNIFGGANSSQPVTGKVTLGT